MASEMRLLEECEKEPLHLSGATLPHGILLVVDASHTVTHVSSNIETLLGSSPSVWLGHPLPPPLHSLVGSLGATPGCRQISTVRLNSVARELEVCVIRGENGASLIELLPLVEPLPADFINGHLALELPKDEYGLASARKHITQRIAATTGFQRVMYYRFLDEGDGEVVAEVCSEETPRRYLGLRFPASDIPAIARALYRKNPWRMIPDATANSVPILSVTGTIPDLTYSDLRSVSPVHLAYLANMQVAASLSFPITRSGKLLALVAAHHNHPRTISMQRLEVCAGWVSSHARLEHKYALQAALRLHDNVYHLLRKLQTLLKVPDQLVMDWDRLSSSLLDIFEADGVQLRSDATHLTQGLTGGPLALAALEDAFAGRKTEYVWDCDSLEKHTRACTNTEVAGTLALRARPPQGAELRLYLTRREHVHEVTWGGDPEKPVQVAEGKLSVAPRRSFEKWVEMRTGHCRPWTVESRLLAMGLQQIISTGTYL